MNSVLSKRLRAGRRRVPRLLAVVCLLAYAPPLAGLRLGSWPFFEDGLALFAVWHQLAADALRRGTLPLWNPRLFCGLPFMGNNQTAVLYPPNIIYCWLPVRLALLLDALLHNVVLAGGAYLLARGLRQSRSAAWLVAVSLALGGAVSAHIFNGHLTFHAARAYLPWELWALLCYLRSGSRRYALGFSGLLVLQLASGYPPLVLLSFGLCCGLLLAWLVSHWNDCGAHRGEDSILPRGWPVTTLLGAVLAAALAGVYLLPLVEASRLSTHGSGLPYEEASLLSGNWHTLFRLLAPDFFGGNSYVQWSISPYFGAHEEAAYLGLITLVLAIGAPWLARRRITGAAGGSMEVLPRAVWWLWALLPVAVLLAMGDNTPLYHWLFDHVALLRLTRVPVRWMEVWCLAAALLAGFSFDGCTGRSLPAEPDRGSQTSTTATPPPATRLLSWLFGLLAGMLLLLTAALLATPLNSGLWLVTAQWSMPRQGAAQLVAAGQLRGAAVLAALTAGIVAALAALLWGAWSRTTVARDGHRIRLYLLALVTLDVLSLFWRSQKTVTPEEYSHFVAWPRALTRFYQAGQRWDTDVGLMAVNQGMPLGIDIFNGYDALGGRRYSRFMAEIEGREFWAPVYEPGRRPPLLRVAGVGYTLASQWSPSRPDLQSPHPPGLSLVAQSGDWKLWHHETPWPRCYLTRRVYRVPAPRQLATLARLAAQSPASAASSRRFHYPVVVAPGVFPEVHLTVPADAGDCAERGDLNLTTIETRAPAPAVLVQTESWYPGWRAWVNGREVALVPGNCLFRAMPVPTGRALVAVVYDSQTYRYGLFLSLCGLAVVAALVVGRWPARCHPIAHL